MVSDKEIEARAVTAFIRALSEPGAAVGDQKPAIANVNINYVVRAALEAALARAGANAEGGEPEGELCKCTPAFHEHDEAGAKHCRSCDAEWHPAPQPSGTVKVDDIAAIIYSEMEWASALPGDPGEPIISWDDCDDSPAFAKGRARAAARRILSALTAGKPHPDDEAVDRFAAAMKAKLKWEREERGRHGWHDPEVCSEEYLAQLLIEHLAKGNDGNFEDVANLCMMLHQRGAHPRVMADALTAGKPEQVPSEAEAERERIAKALEEEADMTPCSEDAVVVRDCARLVRANFSHEDAERLAEEAPAALKAQEDEK